MRANTQKSATMNVMRPSSAGFGLATMGFAGLGFVRSREGRPGPAVEGVFPGTTAALMACIGAAPVVLMALVLAMRLQIG